MEFILDNLEMILSALVLILGALAGMKIKQAKMALIIGEVLAVAIARFENIHGGHFPIPENAWDILTKFKEAFKEKEDRDPNDGEVAIAESKIKEIIDDLKDGEVKK